MSEPPIPSFVSLTVTSYSSKYPNMKKSIPSTIPLLILLTGIVVLSSAGLRQSKKPVLSGKWYHVSNGSFYKSTERADIARWYEFKANNKINYSSCTDWCGCMRETLQGTYHWENDSIISVVYTTAKRDLQTETGTDKLENPRKEKLKITVLRKGALKIQRIN